MSLTAEQDEELYRIYAREAAERGTEHAGMYMREFRANADVPITTADVEEWEQRFRAEHEETA